MEQVNLANPELPRGAPIVDYPVSVASVDGEGNYITNPDTGEFVSTGETMEWSLKPGVTMAFEPYVARTLTDRYHFLRIICPKCSAKSQFEASSSGANTSAYQAYLRHECKPKGKVPKDDVEAAKNAVDSDVLYCRVCNDGKEYKGKTQLAMHLGSQHPEEFAAMVR